MDILQDFVVALFSWVGFVAVLIWFWGEWYTDFPMKGYGEFLHEYEEGLMNDEDENDENNE